MILENTKTADVDFRAGDRIVFTPTSLTTLTAWRRKAIRDLFVFMIKENTKTADVDMRAGDRIVFIKGKILTEPMDSKILEDSWMHFFLTQCAALS